MDDKSSAQGGVYSALAETFTGTDAYLGERREGCTALYMALQIALHMALHKARRPLNRFQQCHCVSIMVG
tara:strand:+ start:265 stop:474 length:210 start_codon:yes stop_codon:yes gene_type:complete